MNKNFKILTSLTKKKWFLSLFLGGFLCGMAFFLISQAAGEGAELFNEEALKQFTQMDVDYPVLFKMILLKNWKNYLLLWIGAVTILCVPIMIFFLLYQGFSLGFLLSCMISSYQWKGIVLFFTCLFPHYICYIPIFILTLFSGYQMSRDLYGKKPASERENVILRKLPIFLLLGVLLVFGTLLETYPNTAIMRKVWSFFGSL